ncbi:MAG: TRAP transporter large permease subunit, partial [Sulfurifustis sp.]
LPEDQRKVPVSDWVRKFQQAYSRNMFVGLLASVISPRRALAIDNGGKHLTYWTLWKNVFAVVFPAVLAGATLWGTWWYVVIHQTEGARAAAGYVEEIQPAPAAPAAPLDGASNAVKGDEPPQELGTGLSEPTQDASKNEAQGPVEVGNPDLLKEGPAAPAEAGPAPEFYVWFWIAVAATALLLAWYYFRMGAEEFELLKLLTASVMPLGILTIVVLAVILFGITTATESAGIGAAGAFLLALQARTFNWQRLKESVFLTAKTTAMVCWLFIGSALFSGVFAILGGQQLVERWVLALNMTPVEFMILSQAIIFLLGWPLEWTEIIVIFVPIFLPLLKHFNIDPVLWGTLVFVNLQAAFLSPPVAMSAFYLKGVSPPHVTLNQIFAGMMPYMLIVILCMVIMYLWPGMTLWLPNYLYGG